LHAALDGLDPDDIKDLQARGKRARARVHGCTLPDDLKAAILQGYAELQHEYGNSLSLAVRLGDRGGFAPGLVCRAERDLSEHRR
jgi:pyruvate,water dikinase